jgi:hypothetical protein
MISLLARMASSEARMAVEGEGGWEGEDGEVLLECVCVCAFEDTEAEAEEEGEEEGDLVFCEEDEEEPAPRSIMSSGSMRSGCCWSTEVAAEVGADADAEEPDAEGTEVGVGVGLGAQSDDASNRKNGGKPATHVLISASSLTA